MRAFTALLISLGVAGCVSIPEPAGKESNDCVDADDDGYLVAACALRLPADCAPDDPTIHPGALDVCDNEIDEDCVDADLPCDEAIEGNDEQDVGGDGLASGVLEIANGQANVHFDAAQGFTISHLSSPANGGANLLYAGPMEERLVGSHMWQDSFSWSPETRSITRLASGPAAHRFRVEWLANGSAATAIQGTTTYAVFPDGRIHRAEELTPTGSADYFSSYVALDPARFSHRLQPDAREALPLESATEMQSNNFSTPFMETDTLRAGSTCAYNEGQDRHELLGYAWNAYATQDGGGVRLPQTMFQGLVENHQFGFVFDWQRGTTLPGTYGGSFQMIVGTTLLLGPAAAPCTSVEGEALAFLDPGEILGATLDAATEGDRDGDGYNEDGGFYQVSAEGNDQLEVQFPEGSNAGFGRNPVLRVAAVPNTYPVILLDNDVLSHGRDYLLQFESDESIWIFLNVPVEGAPLRIEFP